MTTVDVTLRDASDIALAAYADELAAEIGKTAQQYDLSGQFPHEHFELLRQRGALKLTLPQAQGGGGISLYQLLLFQERLARGSGSTALALGWHLMVFGYLSFDLKWQRPAFERLCRDVVQRGDLINVLVTEREAGNLLRGSKPTTVARRTEQGYLIQGRKAFCSAAPGLGQMIVYALVEDEGRVAEFLVPKSDRVRVIDNWNTIGMRSTGSHDIEFDQVLVPHDALLTFIDPDRAGSFMTGSRAFGLQLSAVYLGIATAARDFALDFADRYHSHSLEGSILDAPQVQQKLGEIELLIGASKTLLYGLAERWERHDAIKHRLDHEVAITKQMVTHQAIRIVELAMGIVGGHALSKDLPLERYFRDVQCGRYNPPQDDMVLANLAKSATAALRASRQAEATAAAAAAAAATRIAVTAALEAQETPLAALVD
ncbi:acyl-CoA dehydrogenase family protein [Malikia spinosa]|uniref:acyl-CoA dehydrogenase family protein n=1 Tax=Malikia spinosa TaxID=86180 RepID=UPI000ADAFF46|nr:acyl-CoA dehydrogenase family protein [Malikia spinosa]